MILMNTAFSVIIWIFAILLSLIILLLVCPVLYRISFDCKKLSYDDIDGILEIKILFFILSLGISKNRKDIKGHLKIIFIKLNINKDKKKSYKPKQSQAVTDEEPNKSEKKEKIIGSNQKADLDINENIENSPFDLEEKIDSILNKINKLIHKKDRFLDLLENERTLRAIEATKKYLPKAILHILPVKTTGRLIMGLAEPDMTGKVYGCYCVIAEYINTDLVITPDFENEIFLGRIYISGRVIPIYIGITALRLFFNKDIKMTINRAKKILGGN